MPYKDKSMNKVWRQANREKMNAYKSRDRKANPEKFRGYQLCYRFGLSLTQYNGMCDR